MDESSTNCMTQTEEIWFGFANNCSSVPLEATITISRTNFCDDVKKTSFAILIWVIIGSACCFCGCIAGLCYYCMRARNERMQAEEMGLVVNPYGPGYIVADRSFQGQHGDPESQPQARVSVGVLHSGNKKLIHEKEWEANSREVELNMMSVDEENRIKAMRWERKREERDLQKLKQQNSQATEEFEVWQRTAADRQVEAEELERRRSAAQKSEVDAKKASVQAKRQKEEAEQAASRAARTAASGGMASEGDSNSMLQDAAAEVKKAIEDAYQLPAAERKKKLKDLRMRWHPDKNPMLRSLADEITKIINAEIERCKKKYGD